MGAWSAAINGNDEFMEVYETFDLVYSNYEDGKWTYTLDEVRKILEEHFDYSIKEENLSHNYYFALALRFWELGIDDKEITERVKKIINSGADLEYWKTLDAKPETLEKRQKALDAFLSKITIPNPKPRARKKLIRKEPAFHKGDLVTFKYENNYYAAVTTSHEKDKQGQFVLHLLNYRSANKPSKEQLLDCEFMKLEFTDIQGKKSISTTGFNITNNELKKATIQCEKTGTVSFHEFGYNRGLTGSYAQEPQTADIIATYAVPNYKKEGFGGKMLLKYYTEPYHLDQQMIADGIREIKAGRPVKFFDATISPGEILLADGWSSIDVVIKNSTDYSIYQAGNLLTQLLGAAYPKGDKRFPGIYIKDFSETGNEDMSEYVSMQEYFNRF